MKKIDLASTSRKLHKNHVFNFCDGEHVYPELFFRLDLIRPKEHEMLCERLEETPEFKEFLELDEYAKDDVFPLKSWSDDEQDENQEDTDAFERMMHAKQKSFSNDISEEDILSDILNTIDIPIPVSRPKLLNAFNRVCYSMQKDGYLNGVDLPSAVLMLKEFMPSLSLKSYEYATMTYGPKSSEALDFDINRFRQKEMSSLPDYDKAVLLCSAIYATTWDLECADKIKECDALQLDLTDTLSGMPEYFYANAVEKVNRNLSCGKRNSKDAICENIRGFLATRLKNFFVEEDLTLSERVHINKEIYQIETMSFDSLADWNRQIRPLIVRIGRYVPKYLKRDFQFCAVDDLDLLAGAVSHADLSKKTWQQVLFAHFSRCFSSWTRIMQRSELPQRMNSLKNLANKAIFLNPVWTMQEKDKYLDMVWSLKISEPKVISKQQRKNDLEQGHSYE